MFTKSKITSWNFIYRYTVCKEITSSQTELKVLASTLSHFNHLNKKNAYALRSNQNYIALEQSCLSGFSVKFILVFNCFNS